MKRFRKVRLQEAREHTFAIKTNKWTHLSVDSGTAKYRRVDRDPLKKDSGRYVITLISSTLMLGERGRCLNRVCAGS